MRCRARCAAILQAPLQSFGRPAPARTSVDWFSAVLPDDRAGSGVRPPGSRRAEKVVRRAAGGPADAGHPTGQGRPRRGDTVRRDRWRRRPSSAPISALSPEATAAEITRPGVVSVGRPFTGRLGPRGFRAWSRAHRASHLSGPMKCPVRAGWALQFGYPTGRLQVPQPHRDRPDHLARRGPAAATAPTRRRSRPVTRPSARLTTRDPGRPRLCRSQVGTVAAPVPARTVIPADDSTRIGDNLFGERMGTMAGQDRSGAPRMIRGSVVTGGDPPPALRKADVPVARTVSRCARVDGARVPRRSGGRGGLPRRPGRAAAGRCPGVVPPALPGPPGPAGAARGPDHGARRGRGEPHPGSRSSIPVS